MFSRPFTLLHSDLSLGFHFWCSSSTMTQSHPKYLDMVVEAIMVLNNKNKGSSRQAITKYMTESYTLPEKTVTGHISKAIVAALAGNILVQKSGTGANGSFGLNPDYRKKIKKAEGSSPKKATTPKSTTPKKKATPKKTTSPKKKMTSPKKKTSKTKTAIAKKAKN
ncbi:Late histone H1-like protein [Aphelenchoides besseyi]|nr:Late histone H1-like protein [Aphelenchoides besseyi]